VDQRRVRVAALALILLLGLALRLYHIRNPILDHPGWRQGDQAAIARNFAQLENNIFRPQVDYDGPPPNYIELELQIVPYLAAQLDRLFGVHVIFGRLIVMFFSLATIAALYFLGAEVFCPRAGLIAAFLFAVAPGAVYYGRTFTPDSAMVFFSVATLLFWWRWLDRRRPVAFGFAVICGMLAWLAKPPALIMLAPMLALAFSRRGVRAFADWSVYAFLALTLAPLWVYLSYEHRIAEWHWASGITQKHVLPLLRSELTNARTFGSGVQSALALLRMLADSILGSALFALTAFGLVAQPRDDRFRDRWWMFAAWLAALVLYTFVVVNVERVDYYLLVWLPFAALLGAGALENAWSHIAPGPLSRRAWVGLAAAALLITYVNVLQIHAYYTWSRPVYAAATELDRVLQPAALIVMGHYDPSVLYLIDRKGWEEDPLLWNVHDMTSAIHKGARYFVAVEVPRFHANKPLYRFMQRYRRVPVASGWEVYDTRHFARSR
jgi:4-amino-4-deoxy-L-arabinose transferase-like glycosyltransferase